MALKESGEMYLETIYTLSKSKTYVRSIDVAEYMDYSRPSVSRAMGLLKEQGYIVIEDGRNIILTESGTVIAEKIHERHTILSRMFMNLGVDEKTAVEDACRIEHVISEKCFNAVKLHFLNYSDMGADEIN